MTSGGNVRELALDIIIEVLEHEKYSHLVLRGVLDKYAYLGKQERAFLTRLAEGTIERAEELDYFLDMYSKVKVDKMKPLIRNLLRMGAYQLRYMDSVPDSAVCNEAVRLAKKRGFSSLSGFVNAVLRSMVREPERMRYPDEKDDLRAFYRVRYSMPEWIVSQWMENYGSGKTKAILEAFEAGQRLAVRTNTARTTPEALVQALSERHIAAEQDKTLPYALYLEGYDRLDRIPEFLSGDFFVQDVSSMMVAERAGVREGDYVIDVCAAPGGKSTHIAELLNGTGHVDARDISEYKVGLMEENVRRHQLANVTCRVWDATVPDDSAAGRADIVICDLPCSGLGVLGKKPDIRYKMTPKRQEELVRLQRRILDTVFPYVKPGGTLLYSTCTIHRKENEENAEWFVKNHPEFSLSDMRQMFPGEVGQDGFFIAKMKRG